MTKDANSTQLSSSVNFQILNNSDRASDRFDQVIYITPLGTLSFFLNISMRFSEILLMSAANIL